MKITYITGASSNHYNTLIQFIGTFEKYNSDNNINLIIYDLGLTDNEVSKMKEKYVNSRYIYKKFNYSKYPPFVNININFGEYAWKPIIIYNTCEEFGGIVIWMDSGTYLTNNLNKIHQILENNYIYSPNCNTKVLKFMHKKTLEYMNWDKININNIKKKYLKSRLAGFVGFNYNVKWIKDFVKEWYNYSLVKECIAPIGSNRSNHRQDLSVFNILYYKFWSIYKFKIIDNKINFMIHKDIDKSNRKWYN